ncbi:MAG: methylated-DNA--[protein]-cysteine S-methyltransferase [Candidatus Bathyarchaeia archaeon]|nr:methylated-DNA--[protein]-cysteine S-methyltransferase [Candidatus Bathyarchaeia archaeon]
MISLYVKNIEDVWFGIVCYENKIFATAFAFSEEDVLQSLLRNIPYDVPFQRFRKASAFAERVVVLLNDVYNGREVSCSFSLATNHLSSYARKVIETVSLVPLGYVTSYVSVAEAAGGSPRAVGRVMALNPFPLIVPCHRVVRSDLKLGGYGSGLDVKLEILRRESRGYTARREISVDSKKLSIFPVEFLLKRLEKGKY